MEPFIGEIKIFAGKLKDNLPPRGWVFCDGQLMSIADNTALFSLLGTIYGGDGRSSFALPDLRGRVPIHAGHGERSSPYKLGEKDGVENITLIESQMPSHTHKAEISNISANISFSKEQGNESIPSENNVFAGANVSLSRVDSRNVNLYKSTSEFDSVKPIRVYGGTPTISSSGSTQAHSNMQPYLAVNYIIALQGIYPPKN